MGKGGNPFGGRLRGSPTRILKHRMNDPVPNDPEERTYGELFADILMGKAAKGDRRALTEVLDRVDGKAVQRVQATIDRPPHDLSLCTNEELAALAAILSKTEQPEGDDD